MGTSGSIDDLGRQCQRGRQYKNNEGGEAGEKKKE